MTVHDGPALEPGEIIAPAVGTEHRRDPDYHNNYQDIEAFLAAGGRRGRQLVPLTDGTYFINRWFATVEMIPKTIVPIGYVGVVVSYYGKTGPATSRARRSAMASGWPTGAAASRRGRSARASMPSTRSPATFTWCRPPTSCSTGSPAGSRTHRYDESLKSIDLVTADAYEPVLPLVGRRSHRLPEGSRRGPAFRRHQEADHPDARSAAERLFPRHRPQEDDARTAARPRRDPARSQGGTPKSRFLDFDIELVDVLIGKPDTAESSGEIETLLEQLRLRQLLASRSKPTSSNRPRPTSCASLKMAEAKAEKQTELTNSLIEIEIAENQGGAELSRARKQAEQMVVTAEADEEEQTAGRRSGRPCRERCSAKARLRRSRSKARRRPTCLPERSPPTAIREIYALSLATQHLSQSQQPLVPERVFLSGGSSSGDGSALQGLLGTLMSLLVAERTGFPIEPKTDLAKTAREDLETGDAK